MSSIRWHKLAYSRPVILLVTGLLLTTAAAWAYSSNARNSLLKSRDQVADQKFQLQKAYNELDKKIDELEKQKFNISKYLQDCDRTLRDLDRALSAQDSAYKGR